MGHQVNLTIHHTAVAYNTLQDVILAIATMNQVSQMLMQTNTSNPQKERMPERSTFCLFALLII